MSFCNLNSKSDGRRYDFFFHLNTALPFPLQDLVQRLRSHTPSSVSSTPSEVTAIACELFGNTLRALFLKNRDFSCYSKIFLPNTRGPLGCLLGFWSSGPKPCLGKYCCPCLRLRQACGPWSSSLVFVYRVLAKTTLTITKTSFENKLLHICEYLAIALISYDRILHNVGDVRYNYGLVYMCQRWIKFREGHCMQIW